MLKKKGWKDIAEGNLIAKPATALDNKTGGWRAFRPILDRKKCIHCMFCVVYCPENAISEKKGNRTDSDLDYCKGCGICVQVCPVKAIHLEEEAKFE